MTPANEAKAYEPTKDEQTVLDAIASGALCREAADAVGAVVSTVWRWRQANPEFDRLYREAMDGAAEILIDELHTCARQAKDDPRFQPSLHRALVARRREYVERSAHEVEAKVTDATAGKSDDELRAMCAALRAKVGAAVVVADAVAAPVVPSSDAPAGD